jgi:hypothetical protein
VGYEGCSELSVVRWDMNRSPVCAIRASKTWYCEVRYPPERGVHGNPDIVLTDRTVRPTWSTPGQPMEAVWSASSLPATSFRDPGAPQPPAATIGVHVEEEDPASLIVVDPVPVAHPRAPAPYRLAVWRLPVDAEPQLVVPNDEAAIDDTFYIVSYPVGAPAYRVALIDPLDRWSEAVEIGL